MTWFSFTPVERAKNRERGKGGRGRKRTHRNFFFLCDIFRRYRHLLQWCGYDRIQVVSGLLFAKNYACVALKIGEALNLLMKRRCSLAWHTREKRDPRQWCGGANLLMWTPERNAACYFTLQCDQPLTKLKHLICHYLFRAAERVECENPLNSNLFQSA